MVMTLVGGFRLLSNMAPSRCRLRRFSHLRFKTDSAVRPDLVPRNIRFVVLGRPAAQPDLRPDFGPRLTAGSELTRSGRRRLHDAICFSHIGNIVADGL